MFSILDIGNRKREVHNVLTDIDNEIGRAHV